MFNFSHFIARRSQLWGQKHFSKLILRIATLSVALSVSIMILAGSMVAGFKAAITEKMFGFWGHIYLSGQTGGGGLDYENRPINQNQSFLAKIPQQGPIKRQFFDPESQKLIEENSRAGLGEIQTYANKAGIIRSKEQIEGMILRGLAPDFNWAKLKPYLIAGEIWDKELPKNEEAQPVFISEYTAKRLQLELGESFPIYFAQGESSKAQRFYVQGLFRTGLEEYDKRYALVPISVVQSLNNWRPHRYYGPELWLAKEEVLLCAAGELGTKPELWEQAQSKIIQGQSLDPNSDLALALVSSQMAQNRAWALGDTIKLGFKDLEEQSYEPLGISSDEFVFEYRIQGIFDAQANKQLAQSIYVPVLSMQRPNQGLSPQVSGFEIFVENLADLSLFGQYLNEEVLNEQSLVYAQTLRDLESSIFDWLDLTDINEKVLSLLMILVAIINMTTSMLILILERTNLIGLLQALGARHWVIRKIFLYHAFYILLRGLFWGNVVGLSLALSQKHFRWLKLPEDLYYVAYAPIQINWWQVGLVNVGTLVLTLVVLILPTYLVARIDPVKAIQFR